ncbi:deoxyribonuclease-1 [Marinobacter antarcticus]|uniref:Deoxyribonuclease-1 n=1 Tax=Marinobacter antarcticus TaxID=564117 RepID=A0A1M6RQJ6_9GAMM|nr:deoxyribonuclease-1 [Marinobacter antarcticus]
MKKLFLIPTALVILLTATFVIGQNTRFSDPKTVIKEWRRFKVMRTPI